MLSKAKIKLIQSLEQKKKRREEHLFVAEGPKVVGDLLPYFTCRLIVAEQAWIAVHPEVRATEIIEATSDELRKASFLKTPQEVLALFELPTYPTPHDIASKELCLALDDIQDPGNLGTILRTADAFGIKVLLTNGCADAFSEKTVRASMGAVFRTLPQSIEMDTLLAQCEAQGIPLAATALTDRAVDLRRIDLKQYITEKIAF